MCISLLISQTKSCLNQLGRYRVSAVFTFGGIAEACWFTESKWWQCFGKLIILNTEGPRQCYPFATCLALYSPGKNACGLAGFQHDSDYGIRGLVYTKQPQGRLPPAESHKLGWCI
jgi:hypothetical protein